jgi:hypothetical protein
MDALRYLRSPKEILFRMRQEAGDLRLFLAPPAPALRQDAPLALLPSPLEIAKALRGTPYSAEVERLAEQVLLHRFPVLGITLETGPAIEWRRDYASGIATGIDYFRRIPYLDAARAGDHKIVWEINRHQHLVLLAQAWLLTGRPEYVTELQAQVESWLTANPFMRGINWTSALEVAFRALSWIWIYHLAGNALEPKFRNRFLLEIYRHGCYLERNLSVYFSPNTHLLGEAVALHALGVLFPSFPRAPRWARTGARLVQAQMDFQVKPDGSHFEQSTYYHVYALDFFLFHDLLATTSPAYRIRLESMAQFLAAVSGPSRTLPFLGDDDGGRMFHPYGPRDRFGRATLAACAVRMNRPDWLASGEDMAELAAWWIGPEALNAVPASQPPEHRSTLFPDSGLAVMTAAEVHAVADAGGFGYAGAGHSHSDTLSIIVRRGSEEILLDSGAFTYVGDPKWRDWFRGSAAHNTVRIDGLDQAVAQGAFSWAGQPAARLRSWAFTETSDYLDAECAYRGCTHRRRVLFVKPDLFFVLDEIAGEGSHLLEQFWHVGSPAARICTGTFRIGACALLILPTGDEIEFGEAGEHGWRSRALAQKAPAPFVRVSRNGTLPSRFGAVLDLSGRLGTNEYELLAPEGGVQFDLGTRGSVLFQEGAPPAYRFESKG